MKRRPPAVGSGLGELPPYLAVFDPLDWPQTEVDAARYPGSAYGASLWLWRAAWDAWQAGSKTADEARQRAHADAWRAFPDDPFYPEEI